MNSILIAIAVIGGLGLFFGIGLTVANKLFYVPTDPIRDEIKATLPGANCGGCGYPGCDSCADAIFEKKAAVDICPVGGNELATTIAKIMGVEVKLSPYKIVATLKCQGSLDNCGTKFDYVDIKDCRAALLVNGGSKNCQYGCLGLGTCVDACKFNAISISDKDGIPIIDEERCVACGACVLACPRKLIERMPVNRPVKVLCMNTEKGKSVRDICKVGCFGCTLCAKKCEANAITMVNNTPVIDYSLCTACMVCSQVCPTKAILGVLNSN